VKEMVYIEEFFDDQEDGLVREVQTEVTINTG